MPLHTYMPVRHFGPHPLRSLSANPAPAGPFSFLLVPSTFWLQVDLWAWSLIWPLLRWHFVHFLSTLGHPVMGRNRPRKETYHIYTCVHFSSLFRIPTASLNILKSFVLVFSTLCSFYLIKLRHPEAGRRLRKQPGPAHWTWNQIFKLSLQDSRCLLAGFQPLLVHRRSKCFKDLSFLRLE